MISRLNEFCTVISFNTREGVRWFNKGSETIIIPKGFNTREGVRWFGWQTKSPPKKQRFNTREGVRWFDQL